MAKRTRSYVEEAFRQIQAQDDILDIVVLNAAGNPVRTTMAEQDSLQHAGMYGQLMEKAKYALQQLDPEDEIVSVRVRSRMHETLITPDEKLTFIVIQDPVDKLCEVRSNICFV